MSMGCCGGAGKKATPMPMKMMGDAKHTSMPMSKLPPMMTGMPKMGGSSGFKRRAGTGKSMRKSAYAKGGL